MKNLNRKIKIISLRLATLALVSLLTTPTSASESANQSGTPSADATTQLIQATLGKVNMALTKKLTGPVTLTLDLEKQRTSIHYKSAQKVETDLAVNHSQQRFTVSFHYSW